MESSDQNIAKSPVNYGKVVQYRRELYELAKVQIGVRQRDLGYWPLLNPAHVMAQRG